MRAGMAARVRHAGLVWVILYQQVWAAGFDGTLCMLGGRGSLLPLSIRHGDGDDEGGACRRSRREWRH